MSLCYRSVDTVLEHMLQILTQFCCYLWFNILSLLFSTVFYTFSFVCKWFNIKLLTLSILIDFFLVSNRTNSLVNRISTHFCLHINHYLFKLSLRLRNKNKFWISLNELVNIAVVPANCYSFKCSSRNVYFTCSTISYWIEARASSVVVVHNNLFHLRANELTVKEFIINLSVIFSIEHLYEWICNFVHFK